MATVNNVPKSARTVAKLARKAELLASLNAPVDALVESTVPPTDPMEGWGENAPTTVSAASKTVEPTNGTTVVVNVPEAATTPLPIEHHNPPVKDVSPPAATYVSEPSQPEPRTLGDIFGCEEELVLLSIPSPDRQVERFDFLFKIKTALDKVSQGSSIASTGKPELDREIRLCCGPIGGRTYAEPFNGLPIPEEFSVKSATLQRGPGKTDSKSGRTLNTTKTQKPSVWGQRQLLALERMGPTDKLRVPPGITADDDSMVITGVDGINYDDLPTDLHKSRAIWGIWKVYDPKGVVNGTLRTVRQVMLDEYLAHQPTDRAGLVVIAEGLSRQVG